MSRSTASRRKSASQQVLHRTVVVGHDRRPELQKLQRPRRRWLRFLIRTLLVVMLISGVALGWLALQMRRANRQTVIVQRLRNEGVNVNFDDNFFGRPGRFCPTWLRGLLGEDFFREVRTLQASKSVRATVLRDIRFLSELREAYLNNTEANDESLGHLANARRLEVLYLGGTKITDAGVKQISALKELRAIVLYGTDISNEAVAVLADLPRLEQLYIQGTNVTDAGIRRLPTELIELDASGIAISQKSAEHIASMRGLKRLLLHDARISDNALMKLATLEDLEFLDLTENALSDATVAALREQLPDCRIRR